MVKATLIMIIITVTYWWFIKIWENRHRDEAMNILITEKCPLWLIVAGIMIIICVLMVAATGIWIIVKI